MIPIHRSAHQLHRHESSVLPGFFPLGPHGWRRPAKSATTSAADVCSPICSGSSKNGAKLPAHQLLPPGQRARIYAWLADVLQAMQGP
jgi:hypothetical protein